MKDITSCPICESNESKLHLKSRNFRVNDHAFDVMECQSCSLRFTSPLPSVNEIGEYYDPENYVSHTGTKKGIVNKLFHAVRKITLKK